MKLKDLQERLQTARNHFDEDSEVTVERLPDSDGYRLIVKAPNLCSCCPDVEHVIAELD